MRTWTKVFWAAVLIALVMFLREVGIVNLDAYSATVQRMTRVGSPDTPDSPNLHGGSVTVRFDEGVPSASLYVRTAPHEAHVADLVVHVDRLEDHGLYWLPLYKTGSSSFHATVYNGTEPCGAVEGTVDLQMVGLAATRTFVAKMREEITQLLSQTASESFLH